MRDTSKKLIVFGAILFAIGAVIIFGSDGKSEELSTDEKEIHIMTAKGGYYPEQITVEAETKSILRIHTEDTYDCTGVVSIPELDVNTILPPSGDTDIEIPALPSGTVIAGGCTSSIYGFEIKVL